MRELWDLGFLRFNSRELKETFGVEYDPTLYFIEENHRGKIPSDVPSGQDGSLRFPGAGSAEREEREAPKKQTALCSPGSSWSRSLHQVDTAPLQPLSPKCSGQFGGPCLSSPRSFNVLDHSMDPRKGCLFLKMGWEPRWEGSSGLPSSCLPISSKAPRPSRLPHPSCLEWDGDYVGYQEDGS